MTISNPESGKDKEAPDAATSAKRKSENPPPNEQRRSIFDASYAPEGAEWRKAWSRFDHKKR